MNSEEIVTSDGVSLHLDDAGGSGLPVFFQHGLCGDANQTRQMFPLDARFRRLTLEMRGHGRSAAGELFRLSIATFVDDLSRTIEALKLAPFVLGGISMGAAISLRLAVRRPELVCGLVLARPAWFTDANPANMRPNADVGELLELMAPTPAEAVFLASETARRLERDAPDNLASLKEFFHRPDLVSTAALLKSISADGPGVSLDEVKALRVPTLVIGHKRDLIHPLTLAHALAEAIPGARFVEIAPKADDRGRYLVEFQQALTTFFEERL